MNVGVVSEFLRYESIKRELKTRPINECRCDERLKTKAEESTHLFFLFIINQSQTNPAFELLSESRAIRIKV
jgi:hypothetical protein